MLKKSIIDYIAKYYFEAKGQIDAIVFTAGIGENAISLREEIIEEISPVLNTYVDKEKNNEIAGYKEISEGIITTEDSKIPVYVVPTDEEKMILEDTYRIVHQRRLVNVDKQKIYLMQKAN